MAAALLCAALAVATALRLPVFFGVDESAHFGYAVYMVDGHLPEIEDPSPTTDERFPILARWLGLEEVPEEPAGPRVYVANHPPLFYAMAAPPVWLASQVGGDTLPPFTVRLLNGLFMAAGVVVTGLLARELFPRTPRVGTLAAGLAAVTPNIVGVAAYGHNDGLAFALGATALLLMARLLRRGPEPRLLVAATVLAVACGLSRASLSVAVAGLVAATVLGGWRQLWAGDRSQPRWWVPAWRPLLAGVGVGASTLVLAGWFYWRNQRLYGSPTADTVLLEIFGREPNGSWFDVVRTRHFYAELWSKLYGSVHPQLVFPRARQVVVAMIAVAGVGGAVGLWRRRQSGRSRQGRQSRGSELGIGVGGWVLMAGYAVAVTVSVADFLSKGGGPHPRYFFSLVPVTSSLLAAAVSQLPLRRVLGVAAVAGLLAITLSRLADYEALIETRAATDALALSDRPGGPVAHWLMLAVAAAALAVLVVELLRPRHGEGADRGEERPPPGT